VIIFDDQPIAYYPLALTRSTGDLRCGILKLRQRLQALIDDSEESIWIEDRLLALYRERHPDWNINQPAKAGELLVNSCLIPSAENIAMIKAIQPGEAIYEHDRLVASRPASPLPHLCQAKERQRRGIGGVKEAEGKGMLFRHLADLVHASPELIRQDFEQFFYDKDNAFETEPGVTVLDPYSVWIAEDVTLKPGVVLDASGGPIVIDEGAVVMPNAVLMGPCYIGKKSQIKIGAKIYPGTSIGPVCKIGGEVEDSIFQAYSNKQHDGFLGHSFVGEWVNLGADTNNSDLKNTYANVDFYSYEAGQKIDSGSMFMGCVIGDHSKLGINCSINTGTVIGVGANLWGSPLIDGFIPDLSWGMANDLKSYRVPAFLWTANLVKERRNLQLGKAERELYLEIARSRQDLAASKTSNGV